MNAFVRQMLVAGAGAALMVVASAPAGAQNPSSSADSSSQPQRTIQMVQTLALLDHTLDAKKAKQGETVTAKLQKDVNIPQQEALPKDTVLEGHVDQVQPFAAQERFDGGGDVRQGEAEERKGSAH